MSKRVYNLNKAQNIEKIRHLILEYDICDSNVMSEDDIEESETEDNLENRSSDSDTDLEADEVDLEDVEEEKTDDHFYTGASGLRHVAVTVPLAVAPGDTVTLGCSYDLEGEPLYTVKWYKGSKEFFRYVPKELPHTRVFPLHGINVDVGQSNAHQVVIRDVQLEVAGKYRCEVSADAPTFHTDVVSSYMHVVYLPDGDPKLSVEKPRYAVGDTLRANCTAPAASPPANLTWMVNDKKMNESFREKHEVRDGSQQVRHFFVIGLELDVDSGSFRGGKLRISCVGVVFGLYRQQADLVLEEERPIIAPVLGTRESSQGRSSRKCCGWWLLSMAAFSALLAR